MTEQQRKVCNKIIHMASVAAGGVGAFQIPFGDRKLITPIQVMMATKLAKVFDVSLDESATETFLISGVVSSLGRGASGVVMGQSPISAPIVNMSMAAIITEALGWILVKEFDRGEIVDQLLLIKSAVEGDDNQLDMSTNDCPEMAQLNVECSPKEDERHGEKVLFYILGSIAILGTASFVIPKVTRKVVNSTYKAGMKRQNEKDDKEN